MHPLAGWGKTLNRWIAALLTLIVLASCERHREAASPGLLTLAIDAGPGSLDPRLGGDESSRRVHQLLFNGLVRFGVLPPLNS